MVKKILCALNPYSGSGKAFKMFQQLKLELPTVEIVSLESKSTGYFTETISNEFLVGVEAIVILGGDGTMHDVVNALFKINRLDIPILLFPAGSGNSFNHDLECLEFETAIVRLKKMKTTQIDLMKINYENETSISFNMVGWGLVSKINLLAEKMRSLGNARYTIASLIKLLANPSELIKVEINNEIINDEFSFVLILNTKHTGKGMKMAPLAELNDGLMDVLLVRKTALKNLLVLFPSIYSGKHMHSKYLEYKQVNNIKLSSTVKQVITIDGEVKGSSPFEMVVLPRSLKVIC